MSNFKVYNLNFGQMFIPAITKFDTGEIRVSIGNIESNTYSVSIEAKILSSDDIMALIMIVDELRIHGVKYIELVLPYVPYSRAVDMSPVTFVNIINSLEFDFVKVYECGNPEIVASILNCATISLPSLIQNNHDFCRFIYSKYSLARPVYFLDLTKSKNVREVALCLKREDIFVITSKEDIEFDSYDVVVFTEFWSNDMLDSIVGVGNTTYLYAVVEHNVDDAIFDGIFSSIKI